MSEFDSHSRPSKCYDILYFFEPNLPELYDKFMFRVCVSCNPIIGTYKFL